MYLGNFNKQIQKILKKLKNEKFDSVFLRNKINQTRRHLYKNC